MTTFTVSINLDNAAFGISTGSETARILRELADNIDYMSELAQGDTLTLKDLNGNTVGKAEVTA